jgi:hypothetical protein
MDPIIAQMVSGYTMVFDTLPVSSSTVAEEIKEYREAVNQLGENHTDMMAFMAEFTSSGLEAKQMELITKASTPAPTDNAPTDETTSPNPDRLPTVSQFVEQFRIPYETVKAQGYRFNAEKAYENIFNVANRTDDLLEMNIILEQEEMTWKIVTEDLKDIYKPLWEAQDPNNEGFVEQFKNLVEVSGNSICDDQLTYDMDIVIQKNQKFNYKFITKMTVVINLVSSIVNYHMSKIRFRSFQQPEKDLRALIAEREGTKRLYEIIIDHWGWDYDTIINDPWMKIWMLVPRPLDSLMRIKMVQDPQNLELYRELLFEEILTDKPIEEILQEERKHVFNYLLDRTHDAVWAEYSELTKQANAHLTYFKYEDKLSKEVPELKSGVDEKELKLFSGK